MTDTLYMVECPTWCEGEHLPVVGQPEMVREYHQQHADDLRDAETAEWMLDELVVHTRTLSPSGSGLVLDLVQVAAHPDSENCGGAPGVVVWVADERALSAEQLRGWASMLAAAADTLDGLCRG